ncbi:metal transporter, partial [Rhizobiaceae sp. 2RAB30]
PPLSAFAGLTLLAGGPAVIGLWIGSLAFAPQWSALALAIGAGAILQVIVEVTALLRRNSSAAGMLFSPAILGGLTAGIGFMYFTAMMVKI